MVFKSDWNRDMNKFYVKEHYKCNCGALTIYLEEVISGEEKIVNWKGPMKSFQEHFNDKLLYFYNKHAVNSNRPYSNCNYCVNYWGLDLCGCGSGEKFGKCKAGSESCNYPSQSLEEDFVSSCDTNLGAIFKGFGG